MPAPPAGVHAALSKPETELARDEDTTSTSPLLLSLMTTRTPDVRVHAVAAFLVRDVGQLGPVDS